MHIKLTLLGLSAGVLLLLFCGCSQQDTQKTRQESKQATEQIKQGSKVAAVELKKDLKVAAQQTKAAAQGVRDGLHSPDKQVNINTASKIELQTLPGVDESTADQIIRKRPYHTPDELGAKGVVSPEEFNQIKDKIAVK
jgi:DNA uptake protein ComE-like DNA-binding protein